MELPIENEAARLRTRLKDSRRALRLLIKLFTLAIVLATPLFAQYGPSIAAEITPGDIAVGYSFLNLGFSGKPAVRLNGIEASGTINVNPSWGATLDSSYVRAGRDPESGHSSSVLSAFAGPVFVAAQKHNMRFLIRPLVGMTLVDGSVPVNDVFLQGMGVTLFLGNWSRSRTHPVPILCCSLQCRLSAGPFYGLDRGRGSPERNSFGYEFRVPPFSTLAKLPHRQRPELAPASG